MPCRRLTRDELARIGSFVLAGVGLIVLTLAVASLPGSRGFAYDFAAYYQAAVRLAAGSGIYQPETLMGPFRPGPGGLYLYPPPLAAVLSPFARVPLEVLASGWLLLRLLLLFAAFGLMPVRREVRLATLGVAAMSLPVLTDLNLGNVSILVLFLSAATWRYLDHPMGSIALASALFLRPSLAVVVAGWFGQARLSAVLWTVLAAAGIMVALLPIAGASAYTDYLRVLANVSDVAGVPENGDLGSAALSLGAGPTLAWVAVLAGYASGVFGLLLAVRRGDAELTYQVALGASLLLSPLLWVHYLALLALPGAFLAARGRPWGVLLPLLGWLPEPVRPMVALAALWLPFLASAAIAPDTGPEEPDLGRAPA